MGQKAQKGGRTFGYARVSSTDQDLAIQLAALDDAGVHPDLVFAEKLSGKTMERPQLRRLLALVEEGDSIVCMRADRLARSQRDFINILHDLGTRGVSVRFTAQPFDTSGPLGKAMLGMLAVFAELDMDIRRERQREGIIRAKAEGRYKGRKRVTTAEAVKAMRAEGRRPADIARSIGCARSTVYRYMEAAA